MTLEQLQTAVEALEALEALVKIGNNFAEVETQARELLNLLSVEEYKDGIEIEARILHALTMFLNSRGRSQEALPYAVQALVIAEQSENKKLQAFVSNTLGNVYNNLSDYPRALEYYNKALTAQEELDSKSSAAVAIGNIGNVYAHLANYPRALEYYSKALAAHQELGEKNSAARITGNIGNVYYHLSDYARALEYYHIALATHEELGKKSSAAGIIGNIGSMYAELSDYTQALEYFGRALAVHEELGEKDIMAKLIGNIGLVYKKIADYPRALENYGKALALYEELGYRWGIAIVTGNIGCLYAQNDFEGYDAAKAEEYLLKAIAIDEELGTHKTLYINYQAIAELYEHKERWKESHLYCKKYHELKDEVQSEETKKQADRLDYERKTAEREKQLAVERAEAATVKRILHNTLPPIIADRLINNETFIADSYPNVSVLFMDLVNFTRIAAIIPPRHLIYLLNTIFSNADAVMEKHGLEKIKTIGDAYMAVAGAPVHQDDHAQRAALAALDVMEAMNNLSVTIPEELGETSWAEQVGEIQVRIGLHCGEAIGGVIGDKKFTFDLWGDAVNTASRMESHGEAGRIHVSEEFLQALNRPSDTFSHWEKEGMRAIPRDEIAIKGKGIMKTFFLERA
ncbi:MAG: tetratricopeptide repeat protein [Candidatus Kapabacteria bacterium]|nr:tetratricopeptide repeat protein [Candidatus Kapabacteria bacterium]